MTREDHSSPNGRSGGCLCGFAAAHAKDGIVSLGLAGAGRDGHEEHVRFASACAIARTTGLAIVTHAGLEG